MDAKEIIARALDDYDTDDFISVEWSEIAAHRIVSDLAFHHFKIVKLEPALPDRKE